MLPGSLARTAGSDPDTAGGSGAATDPSVGPGGAGVRLHPSPAARSTARHGSARKEGRFRIGSVILTAPRVKSQRLDRTVATATLGHDRRCPMSRFGMVSGLWALAMASGCSPAPAPAPPTPSTTPPAAAAPIAATPSATVSPAGSAPKTLPTPVVDPNPDPKDKCADAIQRSKTGTPMLTKVDPGLDAECTWRVDDDASIATAPREGFIMGNGRLRPDLATTALKKATPQVRACLAKVDVPGGILRVRVGVTPEGRVVSALTDYRVTIPTEASECVTKALTALAFPKPESGSYSAVYGYAARAK